MAIRLSGINSGLDTDSIVQAMVSNIKEKKQSYEKKKTMLEWKQDAWKDLNKKVYSLYNKVSSLRFSSAYNLKKTTVSNPTKATVVASNSAVNGQQKLNIIQMAQSGYLTGGQLSVKSTTNTTLADLGYTGGEGTINIDKGDGTSTSITVSASTKVSDITAELSKKGLNASLDTGNNRIFVSSKDTGAKNDFNLLAGDTNGLAALKALGLTTSLNSTAGASYDKYAAFAPAGATEADIRNNITATLDAYKANSTQKSNLDTSYNNIVAAQAYGKAYATVQDFYKANPSFKADEATQKQFESIVLKSDSARANTVLDATGTEYTKISRKDADGNEVYKTSDDKYMVKEKLYTAIDENGASATYRKNSSGQYVKVELDSQTGLYNEVKDADGKEIKYSGDTVALKESVNYYVADEKITAGAIKGSDGKAIELTDENKAITKNADGKYEVTVNGKTYVGDSVSGKFTYDDGEGNTESITVSDVKYDYEKTTPPMAGMKEAADIYDGYLANVAGADDDAKKTALSDFAKALSTVNSFEKAIEAEENPVSGTTTVNGVEVSLYSKASLKDDIESKYNAGTLDSYINTDLNLDRGKTASAQTYVDDQLKADETVASLADLEVDELTAAVDKMVAAAQVAANISEGYTAAAVKINGQDSIIELNGVRFTDSSNTVNVNGLAITATGVTGEGDENAITISTNTDNQALYDKIKDFLTEYNKVINELNSLYNSASAKDYQPLTDEEKEEMSDKEIEKWEQKIKDSILRRDSSINTIMNTMTSSMFGSVEVNGKKMSLSDFGIQTLGFTGSAKNEQYAYHIYGDQDDETVSGKTDKLMAMINSDPDTVMDFFKGLSDKLYKALDSKMKSTSMNSAYTVYSDKQMTSQMREYETLIKTWTKKLEDKEDYYYKQFTKMESSMATLNSTQSSLAGYFS